MMSKKAEKSLQMIFGLFILLIISLVVLSLFFKFTEKSSSSMATASDEWFSKAAIDNAQQECEVLCENIKDVNTGIEFCKRYMRIDFTGDNLLEDMYSYGQWDICEDKVPCFVLVDNCKGGTYDGNKCHDLLVSRRNDAYIALINEMDVGQADADEGTCGLDDEDIAITNNWKIKFDFLGGALIDPYAPIP
ncbi:MAG: hypothetical protein ABIC95_06325 [archaeon]